MPLMKNQKNLILPETIIIDIMAMTAQLGDVALDYHKKIGNTNTKEIIRVYHRIIEKLMNLDEYDEDEQRVSLEDICKKYKIKLPTQGRQT